MVDKKLEFCPHDKIVPFKCDITYRMEEFYRQTQENCFCEKSICECDPEICSRYVQHVIENLTKYKQNERIR